MTRIDGRDETTYIIACINTCTNITQLMLSYWYTLTFVRHRSVTRINEQRILKSRREPQCNTTGKSKRKAPTSLLPAGSRHIYPFVKVLQPGTHLHQLISPSNRCAYTHKYTRQAIAVGCRHLLDCSVPMSSRVGILLVRAIFILLYPDEERGRAAFRLEAQHSVLRLKIS